MTHQVLFFVAFLGFLTSTSAMARRSADALFSVKAKAKNKFERTRIAEAGVAIDGVLSDSVTFLATEAEVKKIKQMGVSLEVTPLPKRDFPTTDKAFHNYERLNIDLNKIAFQYPEISRRFSIGESLEGRRLEGIRLSSNDTNDSLPTVIFMGCHHAREHLSVEVPLKIAQYLAENYSKSQRIRELLDTREVWIVPMINPDGAEYDIASGNYRSWRKNRRPNGGSSYGVDLNRNYGPKEFFGGKGSSSSPSSDIYHGTHEFSEPETQAVRDFVRSRKKATMLLTFHTYSELILWPYGHTYTNISSETDLRVFQTMGKKMASWNGYKPEKSSDLYLSAGDTTDWAYEELKIFAFTFELSPNALSPSGFYPGAKAIEPTFKANLEPALYMIEKAEDPYRELEDSVDPLRVK